MIILSFSDDQRPSLALVQSILDVFRPCLLVVLNGLRFDEDIHSLSEMDPRPVGAGRALPGKPLTAPFELVRGGIAVGDCSDGGTGSGEELVSSGMTAGGGKSI